MSHLLSSWILIPLLLLIAVGLGLSLFLLLRAGEKPGSGSQLGPPPPPHEDDAEALKAELQEDKDLIEHPEQVNWLWRPTEEDLERAQSFEDGALYVQGPVVDAVTGEPITGRVYINGELVAESGEVAVLMWETAERPVFVRVEAEGHYPWEFRFRSTYEGLTELVGPVRLEPEDELSAASDQLSAKALLPVPLLTAES